MAVTRDDVEAFLIETIPEHVGIPTAALHTLAEQHGITPQDIKQHGRRLRLTTASCAQQMTGLHYGACVACGERTPYTEAEHRLACCPDCTSPITTWRWERPEPGRVRRKEKVKAARRDAGWPANEGLARQATCNSVFDRARAKTPFCAETVVWKVEVVRGSTIYRSYWCDADLPADKRPAAPPPALSSGGVGSGEQHGLF